MIERINDLLKERNRVDDDIRKVIADSGLELAERYFAAMSILRECCRAAGWACSDNVSLEFLANVPAEIRLKMASKDELIEKARHLMVNSSSSRYDDGVQAVIDLLKGDA